MNGSVTLFRVRGIPIRAHRLFLLLLATILLVNLASGGVAVLLALTGGILLLCVALLLHELAHALVARRLGFRVVDITLWPLGGMARLEGSFHRPGDEAVVAIAGPAINIALALLAIPLRGIPGMSVWFAVNAALGVGNLLPAFPMDGGRLLRAWFARRVSMVEATRAAASIGSFFALLLFLLSLRFGQGLTGFAIGAFIWLAGKQELFQEIMRAGRLPQLSTFEVLRRALGILDEPPIQDPQPPSEEEAKSTAEDLAEFQGSLTEFFKGRRKRSS